MVLSGTGYLQIAGSCEHGNEPLCSIEYEESLDQPMNCQVLKQNPDSLFRCPCARLGSMTRQCREHWHYGMFSLNFRH